jgi:hypothetical protein
LPRGVDFFMECPFASAQYQLGLINCHEQSLTLNEMVQES